MSSSNIKKNIRIKILCSQWYFCERSHIKATLTVIHAFFSFFSKKRRLRRNSKRAKNGNLQQISSLYRIQNSGHNVWSTSHVASARQRLDRQHSHIVCVPDCLVIYWWELFCIRVVDFKEPNSFGDAVGKRRCANYTLAINTVSFRDYFRLKHRHY